MQLLVELKRARGKMILWLFRRGRARSGDPIGADPLRRDPRASLVVWENERTVQLDGLADEPTGVDRDLLRELYFAAYRRARSGAWALTRRPNFVA